MKKFSLAALTSLLIPFIGLAHEGHGTTEGYTITHYVVEPVHALFTFAFLIVCIVSISIYRVTRKKAGK